MKINDRIVNGKKLGEFPQTPVSDFDKICLKANAEGAVLMKNDGSLPLVKGEKVAVFGRMQTSYYKSGTGSGGAVNTAYVTNILDSLKNSNYVEVDSELEKIYKDWIAENPFDKGDGWVQPWAQKEMSLSDEVVRAAADRNDKAIIIIGRTAGEDKDNTPTPDSYLLNDVELDMIEKVTSAFSKVCVILNTGNIIDMNWSEEFSVGAVMYVWQGGQDGGEAVAQILCGKMYPSGKLSDTIPKKIEDYPSCENFSNNDENIYSEDVFVGYRYFETFAKDKVMYPFGFGLSYTTFSTKVISMNCNEREVSLEFEVVNTGKYPGKEVVQVYCEGCTEKLTRPARELKAFAKTQELLPGSSQKLVIKFNVSDMAAYDDTGVTGNKSCYVLEKGIYNIYAGSDVRSAVKVYSVEQPETVVTERLSSSMAPVASFERMINNNGSVAYEKLEACEIDAPIYQNPPENVYIGDKGIKLADVYNKKATMDEFISQLSDFDLAVLSQGEGMNSPKVRPGTGGAFGGVNDSLLSFGIPIVCVTDGPSGLRFDNGDLATSLPNGTLMACTWNEDLTEELYTFEGIEGFAHNVDALLGPGTNIHRIPLCGRNFEYLSEDPFLAGSIATKMCKGLKNGGITGTIKHFAANNKEQNRKEINMIISERALREIYLKPFEMVIKSRTVTMLMTAYNQINGQFCSANPDLNTAILRDEWGYEGLVMTDWWPKTHYDEDGNAVDTREMPIKAQNDLFMVNADAEKTAADGLIDYITNGALTRNELARNAKNILNVILTTPTFERYLDGELTYEKHVKDVSGMFCFFNCEEVTRAQEITLSNNAEEKVSIKITYNSTQSELIQIPIKISVNGKRAGLFMVRGTNGETLSDVSSLSLEEGENSIAFEFVDGMVTVNSFELYR